jgi:hypothetical protein
MFALFIYLFSYCFYFIQNRKAIEPNACVEDETPKSFGKLFHFRRFVQISSLFKPFFYDIYVVFGLSCQMLLIEEKNKLKAEYYSLFQVQVNYKVN